MLSAIDDPALQLMAAQRFVSEKVAKTPASPVPAVRPRNDQVRIGYLSGDLCMHAVGLLTAELYRTARPRAFRGLCLLLEPRGRHAAARAHPAHAFDHHVPIGKLDDESAAQPIAAPGHRRADRPAGPDQWRPPEHPGLSAGTGAGRLPGPAGHLGLPGVDWIIADRFVMPPELQPYCTEKPDSAALLPGQRPPARGRPPASTRHSYGLPEQAFVFCSFNNNYKFTPRCSAPGWGS